jgi:hypothetical protein
VGHRLKPGDRVIDLRAVTRSGGMFAGLVVAPVTAGLSGWWWVWCVSAGIVCAIGGFFVGGVVGRVVFRAPPGQAVIAPIGPGALGVGLRASVAGGLLVCVVGAVVAFVGAGGFVAVVALLAGLGVSVAVGCLAALA